MDPQSGISLALGLKLVLLILLPSEGPHYPHGGEVLLSAGGHLALGLVGGLEPGGDEANLTAGDQIKMTQSAIVLENLISQFLYSKAAEE